MRLTISVEDSSILDPVTVVLTVASVSPAESAGAGRSDTVARIRAEEQRVESGARWLGTLLPALVGAAPEQWDHFLPDPDDQMTVVAVDAPLVEALEQVGVIAPASAGQEQEEQL
ncbi:MAG: hypothetical protein Q4C85_08500 [Actinomyces sp.]|uniref:hypothetical protein n=1 Tax=Actinomyces sp. TaxID=29317 RepID=UPI0026DB18FD|nr:hypothetical protein [Actinomyces sp.]MDO4243777.1 hypothetical protein [Actinomyces sp.]